MIKLRKLNGVIIEFDVNEIDLLKPRFDFPNKIITIHQQSFQMNSYRELNVLGQGEKGETGAKGDKGETGNVGAKGDKGEKGDNAILQGYVENKMIANAFGTELIQYVSKYNQANELKTKQTLVLNTEMMPFALLNNSGEPTIIDIFNIKKNENLLEYGIDYVFLGEYQETTRKYYKGRQGNDESFDFNRKGNTLEGETYRYQGIVVFESFIEDDDLLSIEKTERQSFEVPQWSVGRYNNNEQIHELRLPYSVDGLAMNNANNIGFKTYTNGWKPSKGICPKNTNTWRMLKAVNDNNITLENSIHIDYNGDGKVFEYHVDYLFPQYYSIFNPQSWIVEERSNQNKSDYTKRRNKRSIHLLGNEKEVIIPYKAGIYDASKSSIKKYQQRAKQYRLRNLANNSVTQWSGSFGAEKRYYQNESVEKLFVFIPFFPQ